MRRASVFVAVVGLVMMSALVAVRAQRATPASTPAAAASTPSIDDVLKAMRGDLQASRADIIAKNVALTSEQAAKFWPAYNQYQKEQDAIMDEQLKGIQRYVDSFQSLSDADAMSLLNAHLTRDAQMVALRQKWLPEFQKVLPTKLAVRVIQIDRRLSQAHQMEFSARIPLVH